MARSDAVERSAQDDRVSEKVVDAVAELTGSDPVSLDPLYDVVDPDALDTLFETDQLETGPWPNRVTFTYNDCDVVVSADGNVQVSE